MLGLSTPAVAAAWAACSPTPDTPDAGPDATDDVTTTSDASDGGLGFPEGSYIDSYVQWCEAGAPQFITIAAYSCNDILYVPCGLPADDVIMDAATALAPNQINRCDQVCKGYNGKSCEVLTYGQMQLLFAALDAGDASAFGADSGADGGTTTDPDAATDGPDPNAIPPIDSPLWVSCDCTSGGRRPAGLRARRPCARPAESRAGEYFASMAHLEAASIPAFLRMRAELASLGAPRALLRKVDRAIRDEQRHARVVGRLAKKFGSGVEAPRVRRFRARGVEAMARENVVEGCVRETFGALVATWQAANARDPEVRRAMERIAIDETMHAAISARAASFLANKLDARARARVERSRRAAIEELRAAMSVTPHPDLVSLAGVPTAAQSLRLLDALTASVWSADAAA